MLRQNDTTLGDLARGDRGVVVDIQGDRTVTRRLLEMGLTAGTPLEVVRLAPLGDPIEIRLRGYHLTLRRSEARTVRVRV